MNIIKVDEMYTYSDKNNSVKRRIKIILSLSIIHNIHYHIAIINIIFFKKKIIFNISRNSILQALSKLRIDNKSSKNTLT